MLVPAPAAAGAWIAPDGREIWTSAAGERGELPFYETSAYWEVPVADGAAIVAAPWYEQNYDTLEGWRAEATVGLKGAVLQAGPLVAALQGGAYWNSEPPAGCGEGGGELRALGGWELGQRAFLNLEAAARLLEGGCEGRRLEFTAGYRPMENWLALGQVFVDALDEHEETVKAQLALVRFGSRGRGLQLGVRARVDGGAEEAAFVIGWWGPPGG